MLPALIAAAAVSILTRPEGRVLLLYSARDGQSARVSILTRPEGRVLPAGNSAATAAPAWFQSSPGPKAGCYAVGKAETRANERVSILTRPEGRVLPAKDGGALRAEMVSILTRPEGRVLRVMQSEACAATCWFQSSPGPKAGCYMVIPCRGADGECVSILTRPSGRVLRPPAAQQFIIRNVSILTRPEGRVLLARIAAAMPYTPVSILTRPEGRVLLRRNPSPTAPLAGFNPHPARRPGATVRPAAVRPVWDVSILTRPEGRVLLGFQFSLGPVRWLFQSSPGPKAGCYSGISSITAAIAASFNPHPARRPGATPRFRAYQVNDGIVSILTRPSGRVLR